ncbi:MAG: hypothetical protein HOW73_02595 [Polyangiaceae bacterium]|nr:hypothetical protein [Polyangiaceae bacterium]
MARRVFAAMGMVSIVGITSLASADSPPPAKPAPAKTEKAASAPAASTASTTASTSSAPMLGATDVYDRLPKGKLEMPKQANLPKSIPATEKVDGFYVEIPAHYKYATQGPTYAMVYASQEEATARNSGQEMSSKPTCFMSAYPNNTSDVNWSASLGTSTNVQNYSKQSYPGSPNYGSVNLVRSDRIVKEDKDRLEYEVKLAYVDAETMGVRLHSKQTVAFQLLKELPGRVKVWGSKDNDNVTFLIRREKHEKERFFFGPLMVTVNGAHVVSAQEACPVVFSMKTGKDVSTSAVVQLEALLDIVDIDTGDDQAGGGFLSSLQGKVAPDSGVFGQREAKVRPMRIGVSSSWMSQDTKPVVSVSHGWSGKERTQPI